MQQWHEHISKSKLRKYTHDRILPTDFINLIIIKLKN
jgi:hypothetical protein